MTKEQIEKLESLFKLVEPEFLTVAPSPNYERGGLDLVIHSPWTHGDQPVVQLILAMRDSFPRLLEERERLLSALKPMVEATRAASFRKAYYDAGLEGWLAELDKGYAAVAFAEEPAR